MVAGSRQVPASCRRRGRRRSCTAGNGAGPGLERTPRTPDPAMSPSAAAARQFSRARRSSPRSSRKSCSGCSRRTGPVGSCRRRIVSRGQHSLVRGTNPKSVNQRAGWRECLTEQRNRASSIDRSRVTAGGRTHVPNRRGALQNPQASNAGFIQAGCRARPDGGPLILPIEDPSAEATLRGGVHRGRTPPRTVARP